jgi:hypothetical protein
MAPIIDNCYLDSTEAPHASCTATSCDPAAAALCSFCLITDWITDEQPWRELCTRQAAASWLLIISPGRSSICLRRMELCMTLCLAVRLLLHAPLQQSGCRPLSLVHPICTCA